MPRATILAARLIDSKRPSSATAGVEKSEDDPQDEIRAGALCASESGCEGSRQPSRQVVVFSYAR